MPEPSEATEPPPLPRQPQARSGTVSFFKIRSLKNFWRAIPVWTKATTGALALLIIAWSTGAWETTKDASTRLWWAFSPPASAIYVESPEVYTRERLINERSTEEAWLNEQLKIVDRYVSRASIINKLTDSTNISAGASDPKAEGEGDSTDQPPDSAGSAVAEAETSEQSAQPLTFDQSFKLKSAYRNLIRQRMIENRLDDRHDLEGNSLYILKFDSTVLGVPSMNDRAVIQVRILPPMQLMPLMARDATAILDAVNGNPEILNYTSVNYESWTKSLTSRMNTIFRASLNQFKSTDFATKPPQYRELLDRLRLALPEGGLTGTDLTTVLNDMANRRTPAISADTLKQISIEIISHFAKFAVSNVISDDMIDMTVTPSVSESGRDKYLVLSTPSTQEYFTINLQYDLKTFDAQISTTPIISNVFITDQYCQWEERRTANYQNHIDETYGDTKLWQDILQQIPGDKELKSAMIAAVRKQLSANNLTSSVMEIKKRPDLFAGCEWGVEVDFVSGLVNFARKIGRFNTYSYSVLPRESPVSVYNEIALTTKAVASIENARVGRTQEAETSSWELRPILSTFGDTVRVTDPLEKLRTPATGLSLATEPVVGWVIDLSAQVADDDRLMSPVTMNESVVAIVSVPAWWPELSVKIDRGWLNSDRFRDQMLNDASPVTYPVKLPNRSEMLDTLLFGSKGRQPIIQEVDTAATSANRGCEELSVLVTGPRLWRNTAVTIGSAKADEIEVLPNMEGIIAKFRTGEGLLTDPERPRPVRATEITGTLRVWTSDGISQWLKPVTLATSPSCLSANSGVKE